MRARGLLALVIPLLALGAGAFACRGPRVAEPIYGDHPKVAGEATCVPYPPPAAKAEEVPVRPSSRAVWVDGDWIWKHRRWVWKPGGWAEPPFDAHYAPALLERLPNGALAWYPAHWHTDEQTHGGFSKGPVGEADGGLLACPDPPKNNTLGTADPMGEEDAAAVHKGPTLIYLADAPSAAPPKIDLDASVPTPDAPPSKPMLIAPPE